MRYRVARKNFLIDHGRLIFSGGGGGGADPIPPERLGGESSRGQVAGSTSTENRIPLPVRESRATKVRRTLPPRACTCFCYMPVVPLVRAVHTRRLANVCHGRRSIRVTRGSNTLYSGPVACYVLFAIQAISIRVRLEGGRAYKRNETFF